MWQVVVYLSRVSCPDKESIIYVGETLSRDQAVRAQEGFHDFRGQLSHFGALDKYVRLRVAIEEVKVEVSPEDGKVSITYRSAI